MWLSEITRNSFFTLTALFPTVLIGLAFICGGLILIEVFQAWWMGNDISFMYQDENYWVDRIAQEFKNNLWPNWDDPSIVLMIFQSPILIISLFCLFLSFHYCFRGTDPYSPILHIASIWKRKCFCGDVL